MSAVGDLFIKLGFKVDEKGLQSGISKTIQSVSKDITKLTGAFGVVSYGLNKFLGSTITTASAYSNFSMQTGLATEKLQQLQQVAQTVNLGLTAESVQSSMEGLQKTIQDIKMGFGDITAFRIAGVSPFGDAFSVLDQLRNRVKGLNDVTATNFIQKLGLDPKMLSVLRLTNEEFENLGKNYFLSAEQRQNVLALGQSMKQVTLSFIALKDQAVAQLAPQLTLLTKNFFQWMTDNSDKIISSISRITTIFVNFTRAVGNAFDILSDFVNTITGTKHGIEILAGGLTLLLLPFKSILLPMIAFVALLDDIRVWQTGGDSLFGGLYDFISQSIQDLKGIMSIFTDLFSFVKDALDKVTSLLPENIRKNLGNISRTALAGAAVGSVIPGVGTVAGAGIGLFSGIRNAYNTNSQSTVPINNAYTPIPSNFYNQTPQNTNNNATNNITINVNSNASAQEVANELMDELKRLDVRLGY